MRLTVLLFALSIWGITWGQKGVSEEVNRLISEGHQFNEVSLLQFHSTDIHDRSLNLPGLQKATILTVDQEMIYKLFAGENDFIQLVIPTSDRSALKLNLYRHDIFASDFALYTSNEPNKPVNYTPGLYYRGVVDGDPSSVVAISIFNDEIMGLISTNEGNLVLGRIENDRENRHILYRDTDLERKSDFECSTPDDGPAIQKNSYNRKDMDAMPVIVFASIFRLMMIL